MSESPAVSIERQILEREVPGAVLDEKAQNGCRYMMVSADKLVEAARCLKENANLGYTYYAECLGIDYATWTGPRDFDKRFEVVVNLYSLKLNSRLFLKIGVDDGESVPTLKGVWLGAEYPEREVQDLFGIRFDGNPEPAGQRFLLPDNWIGHPLRKEFPLGGEDVVFSRETTGPAVEDVPRPHAGESWEGKAGTEELSGR